MLEQDFYKKGEKYKIDWNAHIPVSSLYYFIERDLDLKKLRNVISLMPDKLNCATMQDFFEMDFEYIDWYDGNMLLKLGDEEILFPQPMIIKRNNK